jgi:hypothetical protein
MKGTSRFLFGWMFFAILAVLVSWLSAFTILANAQGGQGQNGGWPRLSLEIDTVGAPPFSAFFAERVGRCTQMLCMAATDPARWAGGAFDLSRGGGMRSWVPHSFAFFAKGWEPAPGMSWAGMPISREE